MNVYTIIRTDVLTDEFLDNRCSICVISLSITFYAGAQWSSGLERWLGLATVRSQPGSNPTAETSLRNFGNSVYPALPVSFGGDTKSRRSLLSGFYARGSIISHQSALECVTVVDATTLKKSATVQRKTLLCNKIWKKKKTEW